MSDGYARNFLLPKKLVELATPSGIKRAEQEQEKRDARAQADRGRMEELVAQIDGREIRLKVRADAGGTLYSAIDAQKIAAELSTKEQAVSEEVIKLQKPIKEVGEHKVSLEFDHGLEAEVTVIVEPDPEEK